MGCAISRHGDRPTLGAAVATASPINSLIRTLQWYHELSAFGRERAIFDPVEENERETQRFRRPPRAGVKRRTYESGLRTVLRLGCT
jgi:hypothetical protein